MCAWVGIFQGAPEHLDDDVIRRTREQTLLLLQRQPGFAGLHILADRQPGKTLAFSFWETQAALRAWE
jgi:heme-degrading monooxygenase HmoA